jgi:hypothetical protein
MSGRAYCNKEIAQWGYVALVCIALAFTTITGATASTKSAIRAPLHESNWGVCTASHAEEKIPEGRACEVTTELTSSESTNSLLGSAFLNTGFNRYTGSLPQLSPPPEKHAD